MSGVEQKGVLQSAHSTEKHGCADHGGEFISLSALVCLLPNYFFLRQMRHSRLTFGLSIIATDKFATSSNVIFLLFFFSRPARTMGR